MYAVRLGPFCHGEVRNGGIPDWLYGRPFNIRSNDPEYLGYVERLYGQIAQQIEGKMFKGGGSVIGVQLENEFQHSAAKWWLHYPGSPIEFTAARREQDLIYEGVSVSKKANDDAEYGSDHMENFKTIAQKAGIKVHYTGDRAMGFIDGKLVDDHFYYGKPWEIGMRKLEVYYE